MENRILFVYINKFKDYSILYEYCTILQSKGNQVYYLGISDEEEHYQDSSGVIVYHAKRSDVKSRYSFSKYFNYLLKKLKPELVHVFQFRGCMLLPLGSFFSSTFVLDVRSVHVVSKNGKHSILTPLKNRLTWFESLFFVNCIALTNEIKRMLMPSFRSIPIIPLGANISKFSPSNSTMKKQEVRTLLGLPEDSQILLYSGTINPIRRIHLLIESFKLVTTKTNNLYLIIAGHDADNPDTLTELKELSIKLMVENQILFTGFLQYDKLIQYFMASDIGLCYVPQVPYFDKQPPTKLFEYLAADLIAISTKTTVAQSIIEDGVNGFLEEDGVEKYASSIFKVVNMQSEERQQVIDASKIMLEKHSWNYIIETHLCQYYLELGLKVQC